MASEIQSTKKDVLADLVSVKNEVQTCMSEASLRKSILVASEDDVKEDIAIITDKLQRLLRKITDTARLETAKMVKEAQDKVNEEILHLDDLYNKIDEMEDHIKTKTSTTNVKPLELGRQMSVSIGKELTQLRSCATTKRAKFVLHPILTKILEEIENFTLGNTIIAEKEGTNYDDDDDHEVSELPKRDAKRDDQVPNSSMSKDPLRTTFSRSNTSKLLSKTGSTSVNKSRAGSGTSVRSTYSERQENQTTKKSKLETLAYRSNMVEKKSKLISKRSKTSDNAANMGLWKSKETAIDKNRTSYRPVGGLKATLAERSPSAPLLTIGPSTDDKGDLKLDENNDQFETFQFKQMLVTKKHDTGCYITDMTSLKNGLIVIVDGVHDSLQLFDEKFELESEIESRHPWGLCAVSGDAIAVTLHYDRKVALYKTGRGAKNEKVGEKELTGCKASLLYAVRYSNFRLYILCSEGDIHVLDLKWKVYTVIKTNAPTFKYLDISDDAEKLAVSGETAVALFVKGEMKWQFNTTGKPKMIFTGIVMDNNRVFVCDWENYRVVEITHDIGTRVKTVLSRNITRPVAMYLDRARKLLLISQGDYDMKPETTRQIKVFQQE